MAKPRIPLPKQTQQAFKDQSRYDRKRDRQVSLEDLDIFIMSDQPPTCPTCGARTEFKDVGKRQLHTCLDCGKIFWVVER